MNILFLTHSYSNYVPDFLIHGLRKLLGPMVVDYPRKDCLYRGELGGVCPDDQLCPNWFPPDDSQVDRDDIWAKVKRAYFKYIVCDVRALPLLQQNLKQWPKGLVIIDGEDRPLSILPGPYVVCCRETDGSDYSIPLPFSLPEELFNWITSYDNVTKCHSIGFLGSVGDFYEERKITVEKIANLYPDTLLKISEIPSEGNPNPANRVARDEYYFDLQKCKIVLSLPGAGWDTLRFWENSACKAVHIAQTMPLFIPNDFENGRQIFRFSDFEQLKRAIEFALDDRNETATEQMIREARIHMFRFHLTSSRATYLLDKLKHVFG